MRTMQEVARPRDRPLRTRYDAHLRRLGRLVGRGAVPEIDSASIPCPLHLQHSLRRCRVSPPVLPPPAASPPSPRPVCVVDDEARPPPSSPTPSARPLAAKPYFEGWRGGRPRPSRLCTTPTATNPAIYRPVLPAAGCYAARSGIRPVASSASSTCRSPARCPCGTPPATDVLHVDQHVNGEGWNLVGTFDFAAGAGARALQQRHDWAAPWAATMAFGD